MATEPKSKPRLFIGSSAEGLDVAYSVQENLKRDAEVTVWNQGVFELSSTSMESLSKILEETDFGVFVFSAGDEVKMRGQTHSAVRDNVIFEMGLFIGKLGRERVFFLTPDSIHIHVPSDLFGVTPAKYENNRSDGVLHAATGPACHDIRLRIKKLGPLKTDPIERPSENPETVVEDNNLEDSDKWSWMIDFFDKKYATAKEKLELKLLQKIEEDELELELWIVYCDYKLGTITSLDSICDFCRKNPLSISVHLIASTFLNWEGQSQRAIDILSNSAPEVKENPRIAIAISNSFVKSEEPDKAIDILSGYLASSDPEIAIRLAEIHEKQSDLQAAINVIHSAYNVHRTNERLLYKYARIAGELGQNNIALKLLDNLKSKYPENAEYWGYLGNACLSLDMNNRALLAYRQAHALYGIGNPDQWMTFNIGNLFNNCKLPSEALPYFQEGIKTAPNSVYGHERYATALRLVEEEDKEYNNHLAEGVKAIRDRNLTKPTKSESTAALLAAHILSEARA